MPNLLLSVVTCLQLDKTDEASGTTHFRGMTRPGAASEVAAVLPGVIGRPHHGDVTSAAVPDASLVAAAVAEQVVTSARYVSMTALALGLLMLAVVMNTMVVERMSSYSLKKSLGASRWQIVAEVLVHGSLFGLVGGIAGLLVGVTVLGGVAQLRGSRRGSRPCSPRSRWDVCSPVVWPASGRPGGRPRPTRSTSFGVRPAYAGDAGVRAPRGRGRGCPR
ncbi:ABC transporter permease [Janibacter sp. YIM B02568]|uniref:FtsX-like permease family protein n=1 Tax=Janibacter endophyticus TaxID=2806261 RepID=UPI00194FC178|nr:ABC transporter permease [Janibacter endophyticus]MBM6545547.1 ABC transporter permease [Janibacter endophyticus]